MMHFYQENALGSAIVVRDAAGNFESLTEYDAYGGEYDIQGSGKSDFRFVGAKGYIKDDETGMQLLGERYYLPVLGRFLNQDPIGIAGGLNLYAYCANDPLDRIDPKGTQGTNPVVEWLERQFHFGSIDDVKRAVTPDFPFEYIPQGESGFLARSYFDAWRTNKLKPVEKFNESSKEAIYIRDSWIGDQIRNKVAGLRIGSKVTGSFSTAEALIQTIFHPSQTWAAFQGAANWSAFRDNSGIHVHFWNTLSYNSYAGHMFDNIKDGRGFSNTVFHMYWTVK